MLDTMAVWSCTVRLVAREWKEELFTEDAPESSLLSTFGRIGMIARAAEKADVAIRRIEYASGPVYHTVTDTMPDSFTFRYFVYGDDGTRNEWELRCRRSE